MDKGSSRDMITNQSAFLGYKNKILTCKWSLVMMRTMIVMDSISFCMPSGDVLEQHNVLFVPGLTKNLLSNSCLINPKCVVELDDQ